MRFSKLRSRLVFRVGKLNPRILAIPVCILFGFLVSLRVDWISENASAPVLETLGDFTGFKWLLNNASLCPPKPINTTFPKDKLLLVLVHTARGNFNYRQAIRSSWGSLFKYKSWTMRVVFLVGIKNGPKIEQFQRPQTTSTSLQGPFSSNVGSWTPLSAQSASTPLSVKSISTPLSVQSTSTPLPVQLMSTIRQPSVSEIDEKLLAEHLKYGDIVGGNFIDSYRNLSYKHLMGYKWTIDFCPEADFIIKTDDDVFLNVIQFLDWREEELMKNNKTNISDMYCMERRNEPVLRNDTNTAWTVTEEEWPTNITYYPVYCLGWIYGISFDWLAKLYSGTSQTKFFWIDDVYITGVLRKKAEESYNASMNIKRINRFVSTSLNQSVDWCAQSELLNSDWSLSVAQFTQIENKICLWHIILQRVIMTTKNVLTVIGNGAQKIKEF